jgi:hypothetical protein
VNLALKRTVQNPKALIGSLELNGDWECFILENPKYQIPPGSYTVQITFSQRFQKPLPLIEGIAHRSGIRIHPGNTGDDSLGCLLPGTSHDDTSVWNSRIAFNVLFRKLQEAQDRGEAVTLMVEPFPTTLES